MRALIGFFSLLAAAAAAAAAAPARAADGSDRVAEAAIDPALFAPLSVVAAPREMSEAIQLAAAIRPKVSAIVRARWGATIKAFKVKVGDVVKAGQVLAELDLSYLIANLDFLRSSLRIAASDEQAASIDLAWREKVVERSKVLVRQGVAPEAQLDTVETSLLQGQTAVLAAKKKALGVQAQIKDLEEKIKLASYLSPLDGVVVELAVDPKQLIGSMQVAGGALVARVDQPNTYIATASATENQVVRLATGQDCSLQFRAGDESISCKVTDVGRMPLPVENAKIKVYPVTVEFQSPRSLPSEILAVVKITSAKRTVAVSLPWNAVSVRHDGLSVRIFDPSVKGWAKRIIETGLRDSGYVEVTKGVSSGELAGIELW